MTPEKINNAVRSCVNSSMLILVLLLTNFSCEKNADPKWIELFNGKDLTGWRPKITGYALDENFGNTFRVENGVIKVSYDKYDSFNERFGHLFYERPFSEYIFSMEYRFIGDQVKGGPDWALRNSGVMIHGQDPQTMQKDQDFPISIEVQLLGGDGEHPRTTANLCTPGTQIVMEGKEVTDHCISSHSETFHGEQWVKLDILVLGDSTITHYINGVEVMHYEKPAIGGGAVSNYDPAVKRDGQLLHGGSISLQSESHPVEFRNIRVMDLSRWQHDTKALEKIKTEFLVKD
jgi:hypothetical protein